MKLFFKFFFMSSVFPSKLLWVLFLSSIVLFNAITYFMSTGMIPYTAVFGPSSQEGDLLFYVFSGISVVMLAAQFPIAKLVAERSTLFTQKDFTAFVVRCAFSESVMVYGFVLFLLTGVIAKMWLFSAPAFLSLLAAYPRESENTSMSSQQMPQ